MEDAIQQFLIVAKGQQGKALEAIIDQVLAHPLIFVFAEFISLCKPHQVSAFFTLIKH